MKSECLNIKGLNVWYKKDKPIIKDTNLLVPNHSVVGLIGRNGAGKTTLLKALSSVFDHRQYAVETVTIEDKATSFHTNFYKSRTYTVFTENNSFLNWDFVHYFNFVCRLYHRKRDEKVLQDLISGFHFEEFLNTDIGSLSTGNKKKVFLITAFYLKPPLLILDEPFDGLDFDATEFLYGLLLQYKEEGSILMSSHIAESIVRVCDTAYSIDDGHLDAIESNLEDWFHDVNRQRG